MELILVLIILFCFGITFSLIAIVFGIYNFIQIKIFTGSTQAFPVENMGMENITDELFKSADVGMGEEFLPKQKNEINPEDLV